MTDKQRALKRLEAERRGREFGLVGATAAAVGEWLQWLWTTPGMEETRAAIRSPAKAEAPTFTAPSNARATFTTTYTRATKPKEIDDDPEPEEWTYVCVTTERPSDRSPGAVEEGEWAISGNQIILRDLDGYSLGGRQLGPDEDPATAARRLLQARAPKRTKLVFPDMGIA